MNSPATVTPANSDQLEHALLTAWLDTSDVGLCTVDHRGVVVMLNRAACSMLGIEGAQILNKPFQQAVKEVDFEPGVADWLAQLGYQGQRHASRIKRGRKLELLFKSSHIAALQDAALAQFKTIAITDITELLQAQRQVDSESSRRQWQALNAGVVISDARQPDMPIIYVNPMFEEMSGYASSEVLGRNCRFLQGNEPYQPGLAAIRSAISTQSNGYAKLRNFRKDGSLFVNELFISPVKDAQGVVTHFVGIQHLEVNSQASSPA
jgi:PAS domain S-box-containing protein